MGRASVPLKCVQGAARVGSPVRVQRALQRCLALLCLCLLLCCKQRDLGKHFDFLNALVGDAATPGR